MARTNCCQLPCTHLWYHPDGDRQSATKYLVRFVSDIVPQVDDAKKKCPGLILVHVGE